MSQEKLYTLPEVATMLGKNASTLRRYRQQGYNFMQAKRKSGKIPLYTIDEIEAIREKLIKLEAENKKVSMRNWNKV